VGEARLVQLQQVGGGGRGPEGANGAGRVPVGVVRRVDRFGDAIAYLVADRDGPEQVAAGRVALLRERQGRRDRGRSRVVDALTVDVI
jgi:hypothetical protein